MTRHIIDQPHQSDSDTMTRAFLKIERAQKPSNATQSLQKAPRGERTSRMREFARIEKAQTV